MSLLTMLSHCWELEVCLVIKIDECVKFEKWQSGRGRVVG